VKALLDTHAFLWAVTDDRRLSNMARAAIAEGANEIFLSAVSMWEIVLKAKMGKLHVQGGPARFLEREIRRNHLSPLAIQPSHVLGVESLPPIHQDPFDRLLIAQAQVENLLLITGDAEMARYPVQVVW
jgi:PIN domain nuclease of toxin-antitoxin system